MTTVMLAGMMNVNIAGKMGITRSAIWRLSKRREVKGEDVAVKGDWGKGAGRWSSRSQRPSGSRRPSQCQSGLRLGGDGAPGGGIGHPGPIF